MKTRNHNRYWQRAAMWGVALWLCGCSTTRRLPDGEVLYTGVKRVRIHEETPPVNGAVRSAVKESLEVEPNSSFLGSARYRWPMPFGLWAYNTFYTEKPKGLRRWLFNSLKSDPVLLSQVNPELRSRAAEMTMDDNGYFGGRVDYEIIPHKKNPRKARVSYDVTFPQPYRLTEVEYMSTWSEEVNNIVRNAQAGSLLRVGDVFKAETLKQEQERIATLLQNSGFYLYNTKNIRFLADSTNRNHGVALRVYLAEEQLPRHVLQRCIIDSVFVALDNGSGAAPDQFSSRGFFTVGYRGDNMRLRTRFLRNCIPFQKGELYTSQLTSQVKANMAQLNTFKYNQIQYTLLPADSTARADSVNRLMMTVAATYDYPYTGSLEFNAIVKDNKQAGPGMAFTVKRRNCFHGGELLSIGLTSSYEWLTGRNSYADGNSLLNSYEFGLKTAISFPRLLLPRWIHVDKSYPVSTTFGLSGDVMRRSGFFQMFKGTGEIRYDFYTDDANSHSFSPLQISYTSMMQTSGRFDEILADNRVLQQGFSDRFIPAIVYTYLYDNRKAYKNRLTQQWLQVSLMEAGGILDGLTGLFGDRRQGDRQLLWRRFSQFVKGTVDFRNYFTLSRRTTLATRLIGGIAYAYGNSSVVPYSEQFYIGGANSLRGFSIRGVGPGTFQAGGDRYAYMDQTGDLKVEANVELRFPFAGDLHGALFADAGNIWTLRDEAERPGGQLSGGSLFKDLATDAGFGLRYDLGMLVIRFDVGVPIHDPAEGRDGGYYNITGSFFGNLGYHLAVGYPF